jgi:hypothetical protein
MPPPIITISSLWSIFFPSSLKLCSFSLSAIFEVQGELVVFTSSIESEKKMIQVLLYIHAFKFHIILIVQEHLSLPIVYV